MNKQNVIKLLERIIARAEQYERIWDASDTTIDQALDAAKLLCELKGWTTSYKIDMTTKGKPVG